MAIQSAPSQLSDRDLLAAVARAAADERHASAELVRLLAEIDERRLYLGEGCPSLFAYCTQVLHLSEHAAYHRIEAARTIRRFPIVVDLLEAGALTLTNLTLLRPHLTEGNRDRLLEGARYKTKREVEELVARLAPKPDAFPLVRRLPACAPAPQADMAPMTTLREMPAVIPAPAPAQPRPRIAPLAEDRYLLRVTIGAATHTKLRRAQDLLRHAVPTGDHAAILDRALTLLVEQLERQRFAQARRPQMATKTSPTRGRYIPAAIRRAVWTRDGGRCAFEGAQGRCRETGHLEFHHLVPFADGGPTNIANLALRCRAHNTFESEQLFGRFRAEPATPG